MLRSIDLLVALTATKERVRVRNHVSDDNVELSPDDAVRWVLRSPYRWEGEARPGRVYWMRATTGKPTEQDPSHWDDRSCTRFHPDTSQARLTDKQIADLWTRFAQRPPRWMARTT